MEFLQKTLSTPTRTNEALSRLVFERCDPLTSASVLANRFHYLPLFFFFFFSPAPLEVKQPHLHPPSGNEDIDLNMTYDVTTPDDVAKRHAKVSSKKMRLEPLA